MKSHQVKRNIHTVKGKKQETHSHVCDHSPPTPSPITHPTSNQKRKEDNAAAKIQHTHSLVGLTGTRTQSLSSKFSVLTMTSHVAVWLVIYEHTIRMLLAEKLTHTAVYPRSPSLPMLCGRATSHPTKLTARIVHVQYTHIYPSQCISVARPTSR